MNTPNTITSSHKGNRPNSSVEEQPKYDPMWEDYNEPSGNLAESLKKYRAKQGKKSQQA